MDNVKGGTEKQAPVQVTPRPRPPIVAKKPKPALPRKPTLEVKEADVHPEPVNCEKQNGNDPVEHAAQVRSVSQATTTQQSSVAPSTGVFTPAQDPPPPLPKTPPKGRPSVTKTPPPLPKAPPAGRASVKPKPRQQSVPEQGSSGVTDAKHIVSHSDVHENTCNSENDTHSNCDSQITSQNVNEKDDNDNDFKFSNLRSKFVPSSPAVSSRPATSPKASPRLPLKPKPRTICKNTTESPSPEKNPLVLDSVQCDVDQGISSDRSAWFVSNVICNERTSDLESASGSNESLQQSEVQIKVENGDGVRSSSVKFRKKQSPVIPRKPLPKIPAKPSTISLASSDSKENEESVNNDSSRCDNKVNNSSKNLTLGEIKGPKGDAFHKPVESGGIKQEVRSSVAPCTRQKNKVSPQDEHHSAEVFSSEKVSPEAYPKPTPRKPVPAARPRPAPRKRLSLNRLSETEESLSNQLKLHENLPNESDNSARTVLIKAKSEDNVNRSTHEFDYVTKSIDIDDSLGKSSPDRADNDTEDSCDKNEENKPCMKVNSVLKSRVVYSEVGEEKQYRVIDKSIVKTQKHVTELDDDDMEHVVLRKEGTVSQSRETGDSRSSGPTVSDVKSKFNSIESGSPKCAQKHVPNVNCHKDSNSSPEKESLPKNKCNISDGDSPNRRLNNNDANKSIDGSPSSKDSFDDLLTDCSLLEPTSLLNEIEEILSRSSKYSSLTRSGSSPEKKSSPMLPRVADIKHERSRSCDNDNSPVRPPRPKRELKKLRSRSQITYDSCGSDTESLPETSIFTDEQFSSLKSNKAHTLGPAKPHPPKPKRNKLLKVQRSQSDVTAMKAFLDSQERKEHFNHKRQISDAGPPSMMEQRNSCDLGGVNINDGKSVDRPKSWKGLRPSRKAPPPPSVPPFKITPPSPAVDINTVVPIDIRVKSMNLEDGKRVRKSKEITEKTDKKRKNVRNSYGSLYQSINDEGMEDYSDEEHDYHEIPDEMEKADSGCASTESNVNVSGMVKPSNGPGRGKLRSPPKLPPRNLNNSQSFETSSLSSTGHDFDSALTGCASSLEDVSTSSCKVYPKTSSPNVQEKDQPGVENSSEPRPGSLSLSESSDGLKNRPVSGISTQSDSGSGSHITERASSSESDEEDEVKITRKKEKKLFRIAQEVASSERVFVDVLALLNVDFRKHIALATEENGRPVIPSEMLNRILDYLPQLQNFNEELLKDLDERIRTWGKQPGIAGIFVKKGPFLKLYSSYIRDFEIMNSALDEAIKKYPAFTAALKEFEKSPRCASLALKHYMLKPIQRIPQYKMLLTDYMKHLAPDSSEMKDTQTALVIVSEVAHHANENMRHGDYVQKMLEIQRSLIGQFEVIKPGRIFLKEGELMKLSRKEMQPRFFFLFNDMLLYTTPVATGYRLNNALPLAGMRINESSQDDYKMEFSIITEQRSFTLHGTTLEERDDWVTALNSAIQENAQKRGTFESVRAGAQDLEAMIDKDFVLGDKCPLWIPDARVTMCMLCTCEFTLTWRRHHCRACGRIVCGNCSENEAPLRYLKYKQKRVCDECYKTLVTESVDGAVDKDNSSAKEEEESSFLGGLFERFVKPRRSGRIEKKNFNFRPERLIEVNADDEGARISGYLHRLDKGKKWKKMWYIIKDNALYWFKASKDRAAENSMALLGYEVSRFTDYFEGVESSLLFQLSHPNMEPVVFRTDSAATTERWVTVMRESSLV